MKLPFPVALLIGTVIFAALVLSAVWPDIAVANHCPAGVNCYCDKVRPGGAQADPNLLICEDFEAVTLYDANVNVGGGPPLWGPWNDDTGLPGARGNNSYWTQTYGPGGFNCLWSGGLVGEWRADNLWAANGFACVDIVRNGDFNSDATAGGALTEPSNASGGGQGPFQGRQSLAHRIGKAKLNDIVGFADFRGAQRTLGIAMAVAYPTNSATSGIWESPWKHNEWGSGIFEGWFLFHNTPPLSEADPFQQFFFSAACSSRLPAAQSAGRVRKGLLQCDAGDNLLYWADPTVYQRSRDWPLGTWACVRGYITGFGTSTLSVKIWFRGRNDTTDRLIVDFDYNGTGMPNATGYDGMFWNAYANANQGAVSGGGEVPTSQTTYRYEDNVHIRAGLPVSCDQIGFVGGAVPPAPSNLIVQ